MAQKKWQWQYYFSPKNLFLKAILVWGTPKPTPLNSFKITNKEKWKPIHSFLDYRTISVGTEEKKAGIHWKGYLCLSTIKRTESLASGRGSHTYMSTVGVFWDRPGTDHIATGTGIFREIIYLLKRYYSRTMSVCICSKYWVKVGLCRAQSCEKVVRARMILKSVKR